MALDGTPLFLTPRGALAIGMIVHELVTNAVTYGALSVPHGKVAIHWEVQPRDDGPRLFWQWAEHDGPPITPPERRGFGLLMIERSLRHELIG